MPDVVSQTYVEDYPLAALSHHPDNPRLGDLSVVSDSIAHNGFYGALLVQASTGHVLAGNRRLDALLAAGATTAPVFLLEVDDLTARRILLGDNRLSDLAGYNMADLGSFLAARRDDLAGTGYDANAADVLLRMLDTPDASGYGAVGRGSTPAERGAPTAQSLILPYLPSEYEAVSAALDSRITPSLPDRSAVVTALAREALHG